jgi:hypothetical protein
MLFWVVMSRGLVRRYEHFAKKKKKKKKLFPSFKVKVGVLGSEKFI